MKKVVLSPKTKTAASAVPRTGSSSSSTMIVAITPRPPSAIRVVAISRDPSWKMITNVVGKTTPQVTSGPTVSCASKVAVATAQGASTGCRRRISSGSTAASTTT